MRVYNTFTKQLEEFKPLNPRLVTMYTCGVTVYDRCHLGHARAYIVWDMVRRYLEHKGYNVKHIQNFTDIDDRIIKRANELNKTSDEVARANIAVYFKDMGKLGLKPATVYPKATEHIPYIIEHIQGLIDKGAAYLTKEGNAYFDVQKFSNYGKLSKRSLDEIENEARVDAAEDKRHILDFALWKVSKPGEPSWQSPFSAGRPGWHIECSVMARRHLGDTVDVHTGGMDLIFPHHENEIAQSEALTGKQFVRYWLHNGFVMTGSDKMAKSLGNFVTIQELLKEYEPDTIRFFILQKHYRSPVEFSKDAIMAAHNGLARLKNSLKDSLELAMNPNAGDEDVEKLDEYISSSQKLFEQYMDEDFDTPRAMGVLFDFARQINSLGLRAQTTVFRAVEKCYELAGVLGLNLKEKKAGEESNLIDKVMEILLDIRSDARKNKDWAKSDLIRNRLNEIGINIKDKPDKTGWEKEN